MLIDFAFFPSIWRKLVQWLLFLVAIVVTAIVAMFNPSAAYFMFMMGMKFALSGMIWGGIISGLIALATGNNFWEAVNEGMLSGFLTGFAIGVLVGGIKFAVEAVKAANAAKAKPMCCFIAGTLVLTKDGHKKIEDIAVGDKVWAYNEETGESDWKEVVQLFRNESSALCHVSIEGEDEPITSTPGHKYFVPFNEGCRDASERLEHAGYVELSDKWVSAKDLKSGDKILLSNGKYGTIKSVKIEQLDKPVAVYNFEVEDFHTYYVGKNGVCTHNANCNIQTGDTKDFSIHESKRAAYRAAKSDAGVLSQQPSNVGPAISKQGHMIPGKTYTFGDKQILWHSAGHPEYGMTRHFNYGGWHYFY